MSHSSTTQDITRRKPRRHDPTLSYDSDPFQEPVNDHGVESHGMRMTSEPLHYRTGSDSSTGRLATTKPQIMEQVTVGMYNDDYHDNDPYAVPRQQYPGEKQTPLHTNPTEDSGTPYERHTRDPYAPPGSVYTDDEMPSFNGGREQRMSMMQDDIAMKNVDFYDYNNNVSVPKGGPHLEPLPKMKQPNKRRWFQFPRRYGVFIAFVLVILTGVTVFFVWPRWPTMYFHSVSIRDGTTVVCTNVTLNAWWDVTMRVDNSDNWVPTLINDFSAKLTDANTGTVFATGSSGSMSLPPRQSRVLVTIPMLIEYTSVRLEDATWQSIGPCCPATEPVPAGPKQNLNVVFSVKQYIAGIAWQTTTTVRPSFFGCPVIPEGI